MVDSTGVGHIYIDGLNIVQTVASTLYLVSNRQLRHKVCVLRKCWWLGEIYLSSNVLSRNGAYLCVCVCVCVFGQGGQITFENSTSSIAQMDVNIITTSDIEMKTLGSLEITSSSGKTLFIQTNYDCVNSSGTLSLDTGSHISTDGGGVITCSHITEEI